MNFGTTRRVRLSLIAALFASATFPAIVDASVIPVPRSAEAYRRLQPLPGQKAHAGARPARTVWHPVRPGPHVIFGTIAAINGTIVRIRLRSGYLQAVDTTTAVTNGNFSAPLFIGKRVGVDGDLSARGFVAAHIFRMTNLANTQPDK